MSRALITPQNNLPSSSRAPRNAAQQPTITPPPRIAHTLAITIFTHAPEIFPSRKSPHRGTHELSSPHSHTQLTIEATLAKTKFVIKSITSKTPRPRPEARRHCRNKSTRSESVASCTLPSSPRGRSNEAHASHSRMAHFEIPYFHIQKSARRKIPLHRRVHPKNPNAT